MQKFSDDDPTTAEVGTNGSIRPRRIDGWAEQVRTEEDAVKFIQQMYPQFPEELAKAYVTVLANRHLLNQKLGRTVINPNNQAWDFMAEIRNARQQCAEQMAAESARKLLEDYDVDDVQLKSDIKNGKKKK